MNLFRFVTFVSTNHRTVRDSTEIWLFDVPAQYLEEEAFK